MPSRANSRHTLSYNRDLSAAVRLGKPASEAELPQENFGDFGMKSLISWVAGALFAMTTAANAQPADLDPENTIYMDLEYGRVVIALRPDLAPNHVERFKELSRSGFYDGLTWHRVIEGFMAQTGDPVGDGTGGSNLPNLNAEFNNEKHTRGALSMARASDINSANSQFYVVLDDANHLDGQYTYFGHVVEGMEFVDQIRKGNPARNGTVTYPDRIIQMQVMADAD